MSPIFSLCFKTINFSPVMLVLLLSLLVVLGLHVYRRRHFPWGPVGVPVLGYLPFLDCRRLHQSLLNLGTRFGDVFSLKIGGQTLVVLNGADVIREAFVNKAASFDGRPIWMLNKVNDGRGIANEQPSQQWRLHRKVWQKMMRHLMQSDSGIESMITQDIANVISLLGASCGRPVNISRVVQMALCNVICSICFGKSYSYDDQDFRHLLRMADKFFHYLSSASAVNFFPILWHLPLKSQKAVLEGFAGIFEFVRALVRKRQKGIGRKTQGFVDFCLIAESRKSSDASQADDIKPECIGEYDDKNEMNHSVDNHGERENRVLSELDEQCATEDDNGDNDDDICESVTYVATDLFIGGAETTHAGVMWGVVFMVRHPEIQALVQEELDAQVGIDRLPSWGDRHRLPYTQVVLQEILRLGNVIPVAIPHATTCDVTLSNGSRLPRGTTVMANLYASHMDPEAWSDPETFQPERFLDNDGKLKRFDAFMPFSIGHRVCLGEQLARMELYLAFTHIFHRFRISLAPGERPLGRQGRPGITHSPYPFKICAEARHSE
ncbi:vitamin D 25-hydroxylase-like [Diadema antillarum]|uniref:vitamin D 25-hydroxylase-like n=1 Tax=Diadema antillarum TaxID=105358 RepID=UPI003A8C79CA